MPKMIKWKARWSCCLGPVILLRQGADNVTLQHELGHYQQWRQYHIAYYFIVGIPSVFRWFMVKFKIKDTNWYYSGWPENDADKRGGVCHVKSN